MSGAEDVSLRAFSAGVGAVELATYVGALEAFDGIEQLQELKALARERAGIGPGASVLDVGCGFGLETLRLRERVGPTGRVAGVDLSAAFIAEARRRADAAGLVIDYREGAADRLPFPPAVFEATRAERLLIYLSAPERVLREMRRVTRPAGTIALIEPDLSTTTINLPDRPLVRRVIGHEADVNVAQGWLPGRLPAMLAAAGYSHIRIATRVLIFPPALAAAYFAGTGRSAARDGVITDTELQGWLGGIEELGRTGDLFCTIGYFLFSATADSG
jgi:SAM-dependent methyltransferase